MDKQARYWYYTMSADKDLSAGAGAALLTLTLITETRITYCKVLISQPNVIATVSQYFGFAEFDIQ